MQNNILVMGGTGFLGSHLCEKLVRQGHRVTVPTRHPTHARHIQHLPGLTVLHADVHDQAQLQAAMAGHDAVVNLVAILHGSAQAFAKVHVELVEKLVRAARAQGIARIAHVSALGASTDPGAALPSDYLKSKSQGERVLAQSGLPTVILRPSVIFGAEDAFVNLFARLQKIAPVIPLAGAHARFQPVWVEDVAQALEHVLSTATEWENPRTIEVCGPKTYTLAQLVRTAGSLAGVNQGRGRPVVPLPYPVAWLQAVAMELLPGAPLMSRDNLRSMQVDNVATTGMPGLERLGIAPAALEPIAAQYLNANSMDVGLLKLRRRLPTR